MHWQTGNRIPLGKRKIRWFVYQWDADKERTNAYHMNENGDVVYFDSVVEARKVADALQRNAAVKNIVTGLHT